MRLSIIAIMVAILTSSLFINSIAAEETGKTGIKLQFGFDISSKDEALITGYYPAIYDSPLIFDALNRMEYTFEYGRSKTFQGSIFYIFPNSIELEFKIGYNTFPLKIKQVADYSFFGFSGYYIYDRYSYFDSTDNTLRCFDISPMISFHLPVNSNILSPYLSIGISYLNIKTEGALTFAMPYVWSDLTYYYLEIGESAHLERIKYEGSESAAGLLLGCGFELYLSQTTSLDMSLEYLFQLDNVFKDFTELFDEPLEETVINLVGYDFDGFSFSGAAGSIGLRIYFNTPPKEPR